MSDYTDYRGEADDGTEFLLTKWDDGSLQIRVREEHGTFGPPVELTAQPVEVCS